MSDIRGQQRQQKPRYPLKWIEKTFSSEEKTVALLQPEVENGNLTQTDFENVKRFSSGMHRHLPFLYANVCAVGAVAFASRFTGSRWKIMRLTAIGSMASFGGFAFGFQQNLDAHFRFIRSLENPAGFNKTLQNVNIRLGGSTPWNYGVPINVKEDGFRITRGDARSSTRFEDEFQEQNNEIAAWDSSISPAGSSAPILKTPTPKPQTIPSPPGRWDQIRAANNNNGPVSSWDVIRQNHERNHIQRASGGSRPQDSDPSVSETQEDTTRALDEALFDAMLETERRRTSRS